MLAFALPLLFAWCTHHAWEDYYITLRSSRNLVEGHGLVFNPGERLHTFTSPLGVLVPAFCTWVTGVGHEAAALWMFRVINAALLGTGAWMFWRRAESLGIGQLGRVTFFGLLFADSKLVDFASNGMETAMLLCFVLLLWSELERPDGPRIGSVAASCAGLLWTRPDGVILGMVLIAAHVLIRPRQPAGPGIKWGVLIRGILLGGLLYAPWFAWAWWYYGSPIPHTIVAKSLVTPPVHVRDFLLLPWRTLTGQSLMMDLFMPTYWFYGGWPNLLRHFGQALGLVAAFAWLVPVLPRVTRRLSLAVFLGSFYFCVIILFPWYSPPWTALAAMAVAFSLDHAATRALLTGRKIWLSALRITAGVLVAIQLAVLAAATWEMRVQQRVIELDVRESIGKWLGRTALPGETVFLEPLGYIGYYSQLKTYDYPGLSSNEVVTAVRAGARRFTAVIERLRPTWLVLRPGEIANPNLPENQAWADYQLVAEWNARPILDAIRFLPGRGWLEHDAKFLIFRRRDAAPLHLSSPAQSSTESSHPTPNLRK